MWNVTVLKCVCVLRSLRELFVSLISISVFSPDPRAYFRKSLWVIGWLCGSTFFVCVSSTLHTRCCGAVCADGNPGDFSFKTRQWMQQQQSPLLTADKDAEGQLLSFGPSWVMEYRRRMMMNSDELDSHFLHLLNTKKLKQHVPILSGLLLHNKWSLQSWVRCLCAVCPSLIALCLSSTRLRIAISKRCRRTKGDRFPGCYNATVWFSQSEH